MGHVGDMVHVPPVFSTCQAMTRGQPASCQLTRYTRTPVLAHRDHPPNMVLVQFLSSTVEVIRTGPSTWSCHHLVVKNRIREKWIWPRQSSNLIQRKETPVEILT